MGADSNWSLCMCCREGKIQKTSLYLLGGNGHRPRVEVKCEPSSGTDQSTEHSFPKEKVKITVMSRER